MCGSLRFGNLIVRRMIKRSLGCFVGGGRRFYSIVFAKRGVFIILAAAAEVVQGQWFAVIFVVASHYSFERKNAKLNKPLEWAGSGERTGR